jgi:hypothetical protein
MNRPDPRWALLLGATAILLTGCGGAPAVPAAAPVPSTGSMSPGMVMPDGTTMGAEARGPSAADAPPALAVMLCGDEVRGDLTKVLALPSTPATSSTWADHVYTCTYRLPVGPLVLTVKESTDTATATAYYTASRGRLGGTEDAIGLTELAYKTPTGIVGLVKDNLTLTVDATGLPAQFGAQGQKRTDLAYETASVILGCWTGDDDH